MAFGFIRQQMRSPFPYRFRRRNDSNQDDPKKDDNNGTNGNGTGGNGTSQSGTPTTSPKTGDTTNPAGYAMTLLLSLAAAVGAFFRRKKKPEE